MGAGAGREEIVGGARKAPGPSRTDLAIAGALFAAALAWFSLSLDRTFDPRDEGHLMRLSALVAAGQVPHRDFVDTYGPGVFAVTGAVVRGFGEQLLPVRVLLAGLKALAVAAGFLLTRRIAGRQAAVFAALIAIALWGRAIWNLNAPYAALYTLALTPLPLLALVAAESRRSAAGLVAAGVLAGATILFKHTLAVFLVFGMALALWASAMLSAVPGPDSRRETRTTLAAWLVTGLLPLVPALPFLTASAYLIHLLPIHALMALVALDAVRRGGTGSLRWIVSSRLLPFASGVLVLPLAVLGLYGGWGAADGLIDDLMWLPLTLENYAVPVPLPTRGAALSGSTVLAAAAAGLLGLAGRRRAAFGLALAALIALGALLVSPGAAEATLWLGAPLELRGLQPALLAWAGIVTLALRLRGLPPLGEPARMAWLAIAFLQVFLGFQAFPRAAHGLYVAQGLQALLLAGLLSSWHLSVCAGATSRLSRLACALLLALVPLWIVLPPVTGVLSGRAKPEAFRALRFPQTQGISAPRATVARRGIAEMERVSALLAAEPGAAPLLLMTNDEMILFSSGRDPLLPRLRAHLFWIGWGIGSRRDRSDVEAELLRRLATRPDALVVEADDPSNRRLRRALPSAAHYVDEHYRVRERVGRYRILGRSMPPAAGGPTSP